LQGKAARLLICFSALVHFCSTTNMNPIVVPARAQHSATVIVLHGLGDSGAGWSSMAGQLDMPWVKFIFPSAAPRPVTINGGAMCPAWADIKGLSPDSPEDVDGILETQKFVHSLVASEVSSGIPASRIVIGGFSQGAAMVRI
jgi:predicted esterase